MNFQSQNYLNPLLLYWLSTGTSGGGTSAGQSGSTQASIAGGGDFTDRLELESLDKILEIIEDRKRLQLQPNFTVASGNFLPSSTLQQGAKLSLAVCRIARIFSLSDFKKEIKLIQNRVELDDSPESVKEKYKSPETLKEIFSISDELSQGIFKPNTENALDDLIKISEEALTQLNPIPWGTGFLVGGTHLLTNWHIIPDRESARQSLAQFNYVKDSFENAESVIEYEFDPDTLFISNPSLDYTLVQLKSGFQKKPAGYQMGWIQLVEKENTIAPGLIFTRDSSLQNTFEQIFTELSEDGKMRFKSDEYHIAKKMIFNQDAYIVWQSETSIKKRKEMAFQGKLQDIEKQFQRITNDIQVVLQEIRKEKSSNRPPSQARQIKLVDDEIAPKGMGEPIFMIQHPKGRTQEVVLFENKVINNGLLKNYLRYTTDADYGSSGSPVFNAQWELVALHHAAIPNYDPEQYDRIKASDSKVIVAQQGVRICRIIEDLKRKSTGNPKLQSFIEDFVVTSEQLQKPPLPSGLKFNGISDYVAIDGTIAFASCATDYNDRIDRRYIEAGFNTLKVWNPDGIELRSFVHGDIRRIVFSSDGQTIVSAGDENIKLWDIESGMLLKTLSISSTRDLGAAYKELSFDIYSRLSMALDEVESLCFHPTQKSILAVASGTDIITLWNLQDSELLNLGGKWLEQYPQLEELSGTLVKFSMDGKLCASGSSYNNKVQIWNTENWVLQQSYELPSGCQDFCFCYNGQILVVALEDGIVQICYLDSERSPKSFKAHEKIIFKIECNLNDEIISVGGDGNIKFWNKDGDLIGELALQEFPDISTISIADFSPDKQILAIFSEIYIIIWNLSDGSKLNSVSHFEASNANGDGYVKFSPKLENWNRELLQEEFTQTDSFTVEAWFSPDIDGGGTILTLALVDDAQNEPFLFSLNVTPWDTNDWFLTANLDGPGGGGNTGNIGNIVIGKFNHIAAVVNCTLSNEVVQVSCSVYVNDTKTRGGSLGHLPYSQFSPKLKLIGASLNRFNSVSGVSDFFKGAISEVRLWKVARTENQIKKTRSQRILFSESESNNSNLIGYWRLEEGQGDRVYDLTENNDSGLINGAKWLKASQPPGTLLEFSQNFSQPNDVVTVYNIELDSENTFTVEVWVQLQFGNCSILSQLEQDKAGYSIDCHDGKIRLELQGNLSTQQEIKAQKVILETQESVLLDGIWHHLAFVWEEKTQEIQEIKLYVDGKRQVCRTLKGQFKGNSSQGVYQTINFSLQSLPTILKIGDIGSSNLESDSSEVLIAEVRVWKTARTQTEIISNQFRRLPLDEDLFKKLAVYQRLDEDDVYSSLEVGRKPQIKLTPIEVSVPRKFREKKIR